MKYSLSIFTALFAVIAFLVSCGGSEPGSIYGVVTDKATGEPIKNAGVELQGSGRKFDTGSDGLFEFNEVAVGTYTLYVTKTGYVDQTSSEIIVEAGKTAERDVQLEKKAVGLKIVDDDNNEISELDFGEDLANVSRSFYIRNDGSDKLEWEISFPVGWVESVSMDSGKLKAGDKQGVVVNIDRSLLKSGENKTIIIVTSNNGNAEIAIKATDVDPCKEDPCGGHGVCTWTGDDGKYYTYTCECDDGYYLDKEFYDYRWFEFCTNPCEDNPCGSFGICKATAAKDYKCECDEGYFGNGSKTFGCVNPCEDNHCGDHGICKATAAKEYECECDEGYFWDGSKTSGCVNPCEDNPCGERSCKAKDYDKFTCDLCNPDPCGNGICSEIENNTSKYKCDCDDDNFFDGSKCLPLSEMAECEPGCSFPCKDSTSGLMWTSRTAAHFSWNSAKSVCDSLRYAGLSDWRLPNIDALRTLIQNCPNTSTGGKCKISSSCHSYEYDDCYVRDNCRTCGANNPSISKLNDTISLWSSTVNNGLGATDESPWLVDFSDGSINIWYYYSGETPYVRCVR